jgi:hypothetical protein
MQCSLKTHTDLVYVACALARRGAYFLNFFVTITKNRSTLGKGETNNLFYERNIPWGI